jgi:hypothetical protein
MAQKPHPDSWAPGQNWAIDNARAILSKLPDGVLSATEHSFMTGLISGALERAAKDGPIASEAYAQLPKLRNTRPPGKRS